MAFDLAASEPLLHVGASVLVFEIVRNATSIFNHANVRMPAGLDRFLRCLVVTSDMHIGLDQFRDPRWLRLDRMLRQASVDAAADAPERITAP